MEHVERAGVHSGDSMAAYPAAGLDAEVTRQIVSDTIDIARALPSAACATSSSSSGAACRTSSR